jgi:hypothetical protein
VRACHGHNGGASSVLESARGGEAGRLRPESEAIESGTTGACGGGWFLTCKDGKGPFPETSNAGPGPAFNGMAAWTWYSVSCVGSSWKLDEGDEKCMVRGIMTANC